jgi:hypothetical protein
MPQPLAEEPGREAELLSDLPDGGALVLVGERVVHDRALQIVPIAPLVGLLLQDLGNARAQLLTPLRDEPGVPAPPLPLPSSSSSSPLTGGS